MCNHVCPCQAFQANCNGHSLVYAHSLFGLPKCQTFNAEKFAEAKRASLFALCVADEKRKKSFRKMKTKVSSLTHLDILPSRKWAKPCLQWRRIVSKNAAASTMVVLTLAPWVMCNHIRLSLNAQGAKANITNGCSLSLSLAVFAMKIRSCECILKGFLGKS